MESALLSRDKGHAKFEFIAKANDKYELLDKINVGSDDHCQDLIVYSLFGLIVYNFQSTLEICFEIQIRSSRLIAPILKLPYLKSTM